MLPNPEIIITTVNEDTTALRLWSSAKMDKLLRAFENAYPPLEGYSNGIDKIEVGGNKKV